MSRIFYTVFALFALLLSGIAYAFDEDESVTGLVPATTDLYADAQLASDKQVPILLMFSADYCGYCDIIKTEFLRPMLRNKRYGERVLIRQVKLDGASSLRDFNGNKISIEDFAHRYDGSFTPTVIFVDPKGEEIAQRLVGVVNVYYYGGDLDNSIDNALQKMRTSVALTQ